MADKFNTLKYLMSCALFIISTFFGILPILYPKFKSSTFLLGMAKSFTGGLFLAVGIFHIIPEAQSKLNEYYRQKYHEKYFFPWHTFAICTSFFVVLLIDKVIFNVANDDLYQGDAFSQHNSLQDGYGVGGGVGWNQEPLSAGDKPKNPRSGFGKGQVLEPHGLHQHHGDHICPDDEWHEEAWKLQISKKYRIAMKTNKKKPKFEMYPIEKAESMPEMKELDHSSFEDQDMTPLETPQGEFDSVYNVLPLTKTTSHQPTVMNNQLKLGGGSTVGIKTNVRKRKNSSFIDSAPPSEDDVDPMARCSRIEHNYPGTRFKETTTVFNPDTCHGYLLVLAMAIHSTAAGLALGMQTTFGGTVGLSIALLCHKWAEAMTIGIMFVQENSNPWDAAILIILSGLATPIGVIIGLMMNKMDGLTNAILLGISSGTFIYLAASEIILEEFSITMHKYAKFFSLSLGVALIVGVYFIEKYMSANA